MIDSIEKQIEINAPILRVWKALSNHKQFGEWFRIKLEAPFAIGEEARGQILHPGYEHLTWKAVIKAIEPEKYLAYTWFPYAIDQTKDYSGETPTLVEFFLTATANGTLLRVRESGFNKVPEYRRNEAFRMNENGWEQQVKNVKTYAEA